MECVLASLGMTSVSEGILPSWTFLKSDKPSSVCSTGASFSLFSFGCHSNAKGGKGIQDWSWPVLAGSVIA